MTTPRLARQRRFLAAYSACGVIQEAARQAGISRDTHYKWLSEDPDYRPRFERAKVEFCDRLEDEIITRALHGVDEPVVYQGEIQRDKTGKPVTIKRYSDVMLIFAAKGAMPEKYRDNWKGEIRHSGEIRQNPDLAHLTVEQLKTLQAIAEQARGMGNAYEENEESRSDADTSRRM